MGGTAIAATGDATLDIQAGGSLSVINQNGSNDNGSARFGRAQPSGGHLIIEGGTLTTGTSNPGGITNDTPGNLVIGDLANASGAASSTFSITAGAANVGNNLIVGNSYSSATSQAQGTVTQSGGNVNVAGAVVLGASGIANYTISAGTLSQNGVNPDGDARGRDAFFVGRNGNGSGTFTQSGTASVTIANGLYIANNSNSRGNYTYDGGTLSITGEIKVGASTNSNGTTAAVNNVGQLRLIGNHTPAITANRLTADTANSTLGFTVEDATGVTSLHLVAGNGFDGSAVLSAATLIDLDTANGYTPAANASYELIRATSISALPTLVQDGDAFDHYTLSIANNTDGTQSLIASVPEPAGLGLLAIGAISVTRWRRRS